MTGAADENRPRRAKTRPKGTALEYAVRLLSTRPYSENRLREKLAERLFTPEEIAAALGRLRSEKLLNDRKFAEDFIHARLRSRPRTGAALVRDLIQRGIPRQLAQEIVKVEAPADQDDALARELVRRKQSSYAGLEPDVRHRRLVSLLARRGFSYSTIQKVLRLDPSGEPELD